MFRSILAIFLSSVLLCSCAATIEMPTQGKLNMVKVYGDSLAGNMEGDDPNRSVYVYLPPSYDVKKHQRYPVIYFLHGYAATAQIYSEGVLQLPSSADKAIAAGNPEIIIVLPDANTVYGGSMYANSATVGDWETFIADELVNYIDKNYRTIAKPDSRGLAGHSMGGYGALRIGMKKPGVFGSLYAMSSCCLMIPSPGQKAVDAQVARMSEGPLTGAGFLNALQAQAAAWAPNPENAPYFFDWPFKDGEAQPLVQGKWTANAPLVFVDQYVPILKQYNGIMIDVGDKDPIAGTDINKQFADALTRLNVEHGFEIYDGDHGNRISERFVSNLLPFFTEHMKLNWNFNKRQDKK